MVFGECQQGCGSGLKVVPRATNQERRFPVVPAREKDGAGRIGEFHGCSVQPVSYVESKCPGRW